MASVSPRCSRSAAAAASRSRSRWSTGARDSSEGSPEQIAVGEYARGQCAGVTGRLDQRRHGGSGHLVDQQVTDQRRR